jgi:hypothetical protein
MKLSDFIMLDEEEKKHTVLHQGVLIGKRRNYTYMVFLFQLDRYYVETYCNIANKAIETFQVFDTTGPLNPYLDVISLEELLN